MLFWLTFLQTLPEITFPAEATSESIFLQIEPVAQTSPNLPVQVNFSRLSGAVVFPSIIVALVLLLLISVWAYTRVYVITPNNEAFVRTGGVFVKKKTVVLNGGCIVLPGFHELTRVPLREISIDVERTGNLAVRTQDYLRANMRVTFYVCINANEDDVLVSAAKLSQQGKISETDIKEALEKRADDAIRAAAKRKSIAEIDSDKLGFADEVLNIIQQDLKKVGLTLNNIAISEIEESDTYDENNFFDAQGVKLRTETIQRSIKQKLEVELITDREKQELELNTQIAIEQQKLATQKQGLAIEQEKEDAKLKQRKDVEAFKAQTEREIQEKQDLEIALIERNKILQDKAVEEEKITQALAVQQSKIEADIALEEKNKQLRVAQTQQQQATEVAEIDRTKTVEASQLTAKIEVAVAERESKIAQEDTAIAVAEKTKDRLNAEAERAQAEAAVITATEIEQAERAQRLATIVAEQQAAQIRIKDQNVVELDLFRRRRQAEIARQAAELEAESIRTLAEAERYKVLAEAEGKTAAIAAENALSNANRTAELIKAILPELIPHLPEIARSLAPQPGVLGDARIYAFPGGGDNSTVGDINKLLLSTSGLALIETFLSQGSLNTLTTLLKQLLNSEPTTTDADAEIIETSE